MKPEIDMTNIVEGTPVDNMYPVTFDVVHGGVVVGSTSMSTPNEYPNRWMMYIKAFSTLLPEGFSLPS